MIGIPQLHVFTKRTSHDINKLSIRVESWESASCTVVVHKHDVVVVVVVVGGGGGGTNNMGPTLWSLFHYYSSFTITLQMWVCGDGHLWNSGSAIEIVLRMCGTWDKEDEDEKK
jgi:hypothetical protein